MSVFVELQREYKLTRMNRWGNYLSYASIILAIPTIIFSFMRPQRHEVKTVKIIHDTIYVMPRENKPRHIIDLSTK